MNLNSAVEKATKGKTSWAHEWGHTNENKEMILIRSADGLGHKRITKLTLSKSSDFGLAQWAERDMLWGMPRTLQTGYSGAGDADSELSGIKARAETAPVVRTPSSARNARSQRQQTQKRHFSRTGPFTNHNQLGGPPAACQYYKTRNRPVYDKIRNLWGKTYVCCHAVRALIQRALHKG